MAVQLNDYLRSIQANFEVAKSDALAVIQKSDLRKISLPATIKAPVFFDDFGFVPFHDHSENFPVLDVASLSAINSNLPELDMARTTAKIYDIHPLTKSIAVVEDREILTVLPARPINNEICVIDWLNFTVKDTTFDDSDTRQITSETLRINALIKNISAILIDILGFGVAEKMANGKNFYEFSWKLEHNAGFVCIGGQKNTVLIMLSGVGCTYAKHGWQLDLHTFLTFAHVPKITRIDLANDDLLGSRNLSWFAREFDKGGFNGNGRKPNIEMLGNWKNPTGAGRTMTVGMRDSPKFCRIYEKGKKHGDKKSSWLRCEVEFKAKGQLIPLDVLLKPSSFFLNAYKCFWIFNTDNIAQSKFEVVEKEEYISMAKAIDITKHQFGRFLLAFRAEFVKRGLTDKDLLDLLTNIENKRYPDRLDKFSIPEFFKPNKPN